MGVKWFFGEGLHDCFLWHVGGWKKMIDMSHIAKLEVGTAIVRKILYVEVRHDQVVLLVHLIGWMCGASFAQSRPQRGQLVVK